MTWKMKENNAFGSVLLFSILACGGTVVYRPASGTMTSRVSTYTFTYTTLVPTLATVTSTTILVSTFKTDLTTTYKNVAFSIAEESAFRYLLFADVVEIPLEPRMRGSRELTVRFNYRSDANLIIEEIGIDTWNRIQNSTASVVYYVPEKINIWQGTGSWESYVYDVDPSSDRIYLVFLRGCPEILSVDVEQVSEDMAATTTTTRIFTGLDFTSVNTTFTRTYVKTITTLTGVIATQTPSPFTGIDMVAFLEIVVGVILLVVGFGFVIWRRRKTQPYIPPTPPRPPI